MPPVVAAAGVAAAATVGGAALASKSQKKAAQTAADTSLQVANQNNALAREIYNRNFANLSPFISRGNAAANTLQSSLGFGSAADQNAARNQFRGYIDNSDYAFREGQGRNALASGYSARGSLQSGGALKALQDYRTNLQSGYRNDFLGQLANQQGVGLSGASALAGVGQGYANSVSANNNSAGSNAANAALIGGLANSNLYSGVGNALGSFLGQSNLFGSSFAPARINALGPDVRAMMGSAPGVF